MTHPDHTIAAVAICWLGGLLCLTLAALLETCP